MLIRKIIICFKTVQGPLEKKKVLIMVKLILRPIKIKPLHKKIGIFITITIKSWTRINRHQLISIFKIFSVFSRLKEKGSQDIEGLSKNHIG